MDEIGKVFNVSTYTGNGVAQTVSHTVNLGWDPSFIMVKTSTGGDWSIDPIDYLKSGVWLTDLILSLNSTVTRNKEFMDWCFDNGITSRESPDSNKCHTEFKFPNEEIKLLYTIKWL